MGIYSHQSGGVVETPEKRMENKQKKDMFRAQAALIVPIPGDPVTRYFLLMVVPPPIRRFTSWELLSTAQQDWTAINSGEHS